MLIWLVKLHEKDYQMSTYEEKQQAIRELTEASKEIKEIYSTTSTKQLKEFTELYSKNYLVSKPASEQVEEYDALFIKFKSRLLCLDTKTNLEYQRNKRLKDLKEEKKRLDVIKEQKEHLDLKIKRYQEAYLIIQTTIKELDNHVLDIKDNILVYEMNELKYIKTNGLRNSTLLSVAPSGSIATMLNVSSGVEPWFSISYIRNTKSLGGKENSYEVWAPIAIQAKENNQVIKFVSEAKLVDNKVYVEVKPKYFSDKHFFASVNNEFNAVILETDPNDTLIFIGKGAGSLPTASAVVADIIDIKNNRYLENYQNLNIYDINK